MKLGDSRKMQFIRFIKFGIVGGSGIIVNMAMLWFFTEIVGLYYLLSSVLAIFLSIMNNFIWNDIWTWRDRRKPGVQAHVVRFLKFCVVSSIAAYGGDLSILWMLTHFFHFYYLIVNLFSIAVGTALNFTLNHFWTFKV